jgi:hypothetical protein
MTKPSDQGSFAEIAVALREAATLQSMRAADAELILAKCEQQPGFGFSLAVEGIRRRAELIGQAHELFKLLSENEEEVRRIVARRGRASLRACLGEE